MIELLEAIEECVNLYKKYKFIKQELDNLGSWGWAYEDDLEKKLKEAKSDLEVAGAKVIELWPG